MNIMKIQNVPNELIIFVTMLLCPRPKIMVWNEETIIWRLTATKGLFDGMGDCLDFSKG